MKNSNTYRNLFFALFGASIILGSFWAVTRIVLASQPMAVTSSNPPPSMISYQGYITVDGSPYSGTGYFKFAVVDSVSDDGSINYWANDGSTIGDPSTFVTLTVSSGLFKILLGDTSLPGMDYGIDATVFSETDTYLRVWFSETGSAFQALNPNSQFASTPYALRAQVADSGPEETDPVFDTSPASAISTTHITDWNTSYGWGDHSTAGYLTSVSAVKQLVQDFVVASGESVDAGDVVGFLDGVVQKGLVISDEILYGAQTVFHAQDTRDLSIAALSTTKFVVAFRDDDSGDGIAIIGDITGTGITYGSEYTFSTSDIFRPSVASLTEDKFVLAFYDWGTDDHSVAIIGEVSGSTISFGDEHEFNPAGTIDPSSARLSDSQFVVLYADGGNDWYGTAVTGVVSGTEITYGPESVFNTGHTEHIAVASLSESAFVAAYKDIGNSEYGAAAIGEVSGSNISIGSEFVFNYATTPYISVTGLSATKFAVVYNEDYEGLGRGVAKVGEVTGVNITYGSDSTFTTGYTIWNSVSQLTEDRIVVASFMYPDENPFGIGVVGEVSGTMVTFGPEYVYNAGYSDWSSVAAISENKFVVAYWDYGNNEYGTAIIGEVSILGHLVGVAKVPGSAGGSLPVIISGVSDVHTALVPGHIYYSTAAGSLTTEETTWPIGLAISETELLLDIDIYGR